MSMFGDETADELILRYREPPQDEAIAARNRRTLMDALDALAAGNLDAFWSIFDADVVFHEAPCLPYGGVHQGLEATKQAFERMGRMYSSMRAELEAVLAARDIAILYQTITFKVRDNGNTGSLPVAEMYRFRDGKVVEWRALYFDSNMVAQALSGAPSR
jgi:ketosteroid isomerase-like protein